MRVSSGYKSKTFSFWGFAAEVPANWDLSALAINGRDALFAIGDGERNRLEVRWRTENEKEHLSVEDISRRFHEASRKRLKSLEINEGAFYATVDDNQALVSPWTYQNDRGYDVVWHCAEWRRFYVMRYLLGNELEFKQILASVRCREVPELIRWKYLGLDLEIPKDYEIIYQRVDLGEITAVFSSSWESDGNRGPAIFKTPKRLVIKRAPAREPEELEGWLTTEAKQLIKKFIGAARSEGTPSETEFNGHRALSLDFVAKASFLSTGARYSAISWVCDLSDSTYLLIRPVGLIGERKPQEVEGDKLRIHCHPERGTTSAWVGFIVLY